MSSIRTLFALSLPLLLVTGCPDAEGQYDEFKDRFTELHPGSGGASGAAGAAGGDAGPCVPPKPGEIDGDYLFALSAVINPPLPIMFLAKVTTEDSGGSTAMRWNLQGILWSDRTTLVGTPFDLPPFTIGADGAYDAKLPPLDVVGEANPMSHTAITAEVTLAGKFCGTGGNYCGTADGNVSKPLSIPLAGSTWTLEKLASPGTYPEPPHIDCKQTLAAPKCCLTSPPSCADNSVCPT